MDSNPRMTRSPMSRNPATQTQAAIQAQGHKDRGHEDARRWPRETKTAPTSHARERCALTAQSKAKMATQPKRHDSPALGPTKQGEAGQDDANTPTHSRLNHAGHDSGVPAHQAPSLHIGMPISPALTKVTH